MQKNRIVTLDIAKGLAITLVVYGHVMQGMGHRHLIDENFHRFSNTFVYSFHMPVFFFVSGLFSKIISNVESKELFKRKVAQILELFSC